MFLDLRFWLIIKRLLSNYKETKKFFENKKDTKLIYFEIETEILFAYLNYDIIKTVSILIENARKYDLKKIDSELIKNFDDWPDELHDLKLLLKMIWLIKSLRETSVKNPFQLLFCGKQYMCHPGTTRLLVSSYLLPSKKIKGFYVWDKNIDKIPFILEHNHKEIKSPIKFLLLFSFLAPFRVKYAKLTEKTDCSDSPDIENSHRIFQMAQKCFLSFNQKFETDFITFHQSIHWKKIKNKVFLSDNVKFYGEDCCDISGIKFKKINGYWLKED